MTEEISPATYPGRGWRLIDLAKLQYPPAWFAAPVTALGILVTLVLIGIFLWTLARVAGETFSSGKPDDINKLLLALAGLAGAPFVVWRAYTAHSQVSVARESHYTTLFTKAVEQLGATRELKRREARGAAGEGAYAQEITETQPNLEVRLGAVYALERIAKDSERDHWAIVEVLCAYARNPQNCGIAVGVASKDDTNSWVDRLARPRVDVQAALTVVGSRPYRPGEIGQAAKPMLDLSNGNFQKCSFSGGQFRRARFSDTALDDAALIAADCREASFLRVSAVNASFDRANLERAIFANVGMESVSFRNADLKFTRFRRGDFSFADFVGADLSGASLERGYYRDAMFHEAKLFGTALFNIDLSETDGLTESQIAEARGDITTLLPDGLKRPPQWPEHRLGLVERNKLTAG